MRAIVTGASPGIGGSTIRKLAQIANQKNEKLQDNLMESVKSVSIKDDENQEKEIKNKEIESFIDEDLQAFKIKSSEVVDKENNEKKAINPVIDFKSKPEVKALIPLPPKPKYSYLKKWLLRN